MGREFCKLGGCITPPRHGSDFCCDICRHDHYEVRPVVEELSIALAHADAELEYLVREMGSSYIWKNITMKDMENACLKASLVDAFIRAREIVERIPPWKNDQGHASP